MPPSIATVARSARTLGESLSALADLALPAACAGCGVAGTPWCRECAGHFDRAVARPGVVTVPVEGAPLVVAAGVYDGVVRDGIVAFKDGGRRDLVSVLAPALRSALVRVATGPEAGGGPVLAVPVPSSRAARRRRGDVPIDLLARHALADAAVLTARPWLWAPLLRHRRRVRDQSTLSRADRAANVDRAFTVRTGGAHLLVGANVVLVDDVVTTGATLTEADRAVRDAGAETVVGAVIAATALRARRPDTR